MELLGSILSKLQLRGPGPLQARQIYRVLGRVLGEDQTRQVRIASLRRGRLVLEAPSAAQAFEWQAFRRDALLEEFQVDPNLRSIRDVRVRVGSWRSDGRQGKH